MAASLSDPGLPGLSAHEPSVSLCACSCSGVELEHFCDRVVGNKTHVYAGARLCQHAGTKHWPSHELYISNDW